MRAATMPQRFEEALQAVGRTVRRRGSAADKAMLDKVAATRATFASWCAELADAPGSPSLNHNDLHDANVFAPEGRLLFFDFGDAVASSPLAALRIPLEGYARRLGTDAADPRVRAVADAALEVWSDLAPRSQLRAALPAAWRLAALGRAESWHRILSTVPERFVDEDYRGADADWLAAAAL
jgi:Ser/Thr protein kinase RdoA (MazF antagonist)